MRVTIAFIIGILLGASGKFIYIAHAEKPKEEMSAAEQMCFVLVANHIAPKCYWTPARP